MVFKNPYGYLIKNFKIIHLFLTVLYVYLAIKVSSILQYYNRFIEGVASKLDAVSYIDYYYIFISILSIVICVVVYLLMRYKKKPRLLYLLLIILYIIVPIMIYVSYQGLNVISFSVLETKTLRLYRDLLRIMVWIQYVSIVFVLFRGLGFDIKKFNFVGDLQNLQLDEKDEEEIEIALGEGKNFRRNLRRNLREFRYYYLENKVFIFLGIIILIVVLGSSFYFHKEVINKEYRENEVFSSDVFRFQVLNSFITNRDYQNNIITNTDTSFVVVRLSLGANHEDREFNTSNLLLKVNHHSYSSSSRFSQRFVDLGATYKGGKISGLHTYLFIYNIDNEDIGSKMSLEYAGDLVVKLNPISLDKSDKKEEYRLGQKIDWSNSIFDGGYFSVSSYEVEKKFSYAYQYDVMGKMNEAHLSIEDDSGVILHLVMDCVFPFDSNYYSFLDSYAELGYKVGEEEFVSQLFRNKTPGSYRDGIYVLVDGNVLNASSIWLNIRVRNYSYVYVLK